jgi:hypothetical protein
LIKQGAGPDGNSLELKPVHEVQQIRASHLLLAALGLGVWEPGKLTCTPRESLMGSVEWKKTSNAVGQAIRSSMTVKNKTVMGWHEAMLAKVAKEGRTNKRKREI